MNNEEFYYHKTMIKLNSMDNKLEQILQNQANLSDRLHRVELNVNIKPVIDKEDFDCVVKDLMLFLQKEGSCCLIDAIKMYRILTGTGLKEAKEAVISIWESKYNKSVKITDVH